LFPSNFSNHIVGPEILIHIRTSIRQFILLSDIDLFHISREVDDLKYIELENDYISCLSSILCEQDLFLGRLSEETYLSVVLLEILNELIIEEQNIISNVLYEAKDNFL
jgi:hypothetical protein